MSQRASSRYRIPAHSSAGFRDRRTLHYMPCNTPLSTFKKISKPIPPSTTTLPSNRRRKGSSTIITPHGRSFGHHPAAHRPNALWGIWAGASFHDLYIAEQVSRRHGGCTTINAKPLRDEIDLRSSLRWKHGSSGRLRPNSKFDFSSSGQSRRTLSRSYRVLQSGTRGSP